MGDRRNFRFYRAVILSLIVHALILGLTPKKPSALAPGPMANTPLNVVILPAEVQAEVTAPAPVEPVPTPTQTHRPVPKPQVQPPQITPIAPIPREAPAPLPLPPPIPAPPVDMLAAIEARRAQRRAAEASAARGPPASVQPTEDAATRNLATLSGREGVGGVFQIMRIGSRSAEFAFNGWRPDSRSQWREVIEVDIGNSPNINLAIIRRMIELIRTHYTGDFHWESHRFGKVIVLSARPEDNEALEDFLYREFFGTPVINIRR